MKNNFKYYVVSWIIFVGLFQIVCFVTPSEIGGASKFTSSFWVGYAFAMLAFLIHFIFMCRMLQENYEEKNRINAPLVYISIGEILVMIFASVVCILVPGIPSWIGIIVCYAILAVSILFLLSSKIVGERAVGGNQKLNARVSIFRTMTDDAMILINIANSKEEKQIAQKVYDKIRYSDPISCEELLEEEKNLQKKLHSLAEMFAEHVELTLINKQAEEFANLVQIRNNKCKSLKRKL